jgi:hypothetical protein
MTAQPERKALAWAHGVLAVERLAGMLGPATFVLPDGRQVSPLQVAPRADEPQAATLPPVLSQLRGEWPCVPFGYPLPPDGMTPDWAAVVPAAETADDVHGYSSNHRWDWTDAADGTLALACTYPAGHPIARLDRTVRPDPRAAAIDVTLGVTARAACRLPIGLHWTFRLPAQAGAARLEPGGYDHGRTHPGTIEPGAAMFAQDRRFARLDAVPGRNGATVDATRLPLAQDIEEVLELNGSDGSFALANEAEGYRVRISWDPHACPSVLLWLSNRGRKQYPWSGRHVAVGIEPVCSPFGLGVATAGADNPIARSGTPTAVAFDPAAPFHTRYRLAVEPL